MIGSILVSLLTLVDLIMLLLCKASVQGACFSAVGQFTQLVAGLFASGGPLINLGTSDLVRVGNFSLELQNGANGLIANNGVRFRSEARYAIRTLDIANNDAVMRFPRLRDFAAFRSSALNTTLTQDKGLSVLPANGALLTPNNWAVAQGAPQVFIDFGGRFSVPRFTGAARQDLLSPFKQQPAGLNRLFSVFLNTGFQVPGHDCAVFKCSLKPAAGSSSTLVPVFLDILPPDLDGFRRPHVPVSQVGWDTRFTVANQRDFDNDGLVSIAFGGSDTSPTEFDQDRDGLSDGYEAQLNAQAVLVQAFRADTDGDGLLDLLSPGARLGPTANLPVDTATRPLRDGQQVRYTISYTNQGSSVARAVALELRAYDALRLPGGAMQRIELGDVAPGAGGSVEVTATVRAAGGTIGELHVNTRDAARGVYDWTWLQHQVDAAPPEGLELHTPEAYVGPGLNRLAGVVRDPAGVPEVRLTLELLPTGRSEALVCADSEPDDGQWQCRWDAGDGAASGD